MAQIEGFVDNYEHPDVLLGWARSAGEGPVEVLAELDGREAARGRTGRFRPDLDGDYGFRLQVQAVGVLRDLIVEGRLVVSAEADGVRRPLPVHAPLYGRLRTAQLARSRILEDAPPNEYSAFELPVGLCSPDGVAVVGREGEMFLLRGDDRLLKQYRAAPDAPEVLSLADQWLALFRARREALRQRDSSFLQLIIPEKSTVLRRLFPAAIPACTPLLERLEADIAADPEVAAVYVSGRRVFEARPGERLFRRLDSHCSPLGTFRLFEALLARSGASVREPPFTWTERMPGDLGSRFLGPRSREAVDAPDAAAFAGAEAGLERVLFEPTANLIGTRVSWRNPAAPDPRRVVAFGNSFFAVGETPQDLSWWFARTFREFHLLWSWDVDLALVDELGPDVVVAQTIERYLDRAAEQ